MEISQQQQRNESAPTSPEPDVTSTVGMPVKKDSNSPPLPLAGGGTDVNPLKSDPDLQVLLKRLSAIKKYKKFQGWKAKFLERLEQFLYEEGMGPAQMSCNDFDSLLQKFVKRATKVQDHIDKGELSETRKTVKATLGLNEMCNSLTNVVSELEHWIPFDKKEEKKRNFTKFHLGAVLIRQGFHQYVLLKDIETALGKIGTEIENVADRQQHELFAAYVTQVQRFCDVMADLNLYEIMMKCIEFAEEPEDESEDPDPINVIVKTYDGKTLRLEFEVDETIENLKNAIEDACQLAPERQLLKYQGTELNDDKKTFMQLEIPDGATLTVEPVKVPITVNTWDGREIEMMIDPAKTMGEIKQQLEEESELKADNQLLSQNGMPFGDDSQTAEFYGLKAGSKIDLEPKSFQVNVVLPDGKSHLIEVAPSDTSEKIKAKIEEATGTPVPRQVLMFQGNELPGEGATLKEVGVREGSTIDVQFLKVPLTVNLWDGRKLEVMIDPYDTLSDIKNQLEPESGLKAENQKLSRNGIAFSNDDNTAEFYGIKAGSELDLKPKSFKVSVEMPDGSSITVDVVQSDTSDSIKAKIEGATGMTVPRQVLKYKGKEFPGGGATAKDMGLEEGSTVNVEVFRVPVTVNTMDGQQITAMVDPTDTLGAIKSQLEKESGLSPENQKIFMDGNELADDDKAAADYGIKEGSELDLEPRSFEVTVEMPDGKIITVDIAPSDTTDKIKAKIEDATGMAAPRQVLETQGNELPSGKSAKEMGINAGSTINVEVLKVPVTVNTMDGKQIEVMVDPMDTLGAIKRDLQKESGLSPNNQKIFLNGTELVDDNETAADCGIKEGSELDLEPRSIGVTVEMPDGKTITVDIAPSDTTDNIKAKIEDATGMAAPRQLLKANGKKLPSGKTTAKDIGIQADSTINVEVLKVPVTVNTMDGKQIEVMVDPTDTLGTIKRDLQKESGLSPDNQRLFMHTKELADNKKTAKDCGIKAGSELDLEPRLIKVTVELPDGTSISVDLAPADTRDTIKAKIEKESGMAALRQVLHFDGNKFPTDKTVKDVGMREGSTVTVEIFKFPITVQTHDNQTLSLDVEPDDTIESIKKVLQKKTSLATHKQCLRFGGEELDKNRLTVKDYGIGQGAKLTLEPLMDAIIFVDIKCGTLFAIDREDVIEKKALTPNQGNKLDFVEATRDSVARDKIRKLMEGSPTLGVATQVVVQAVEVEDYELGEAEKVKNMWGVNLKKREKNKAGEEFIFVDSKTGAAGELARKKYVDMKFITPVTSDKGKETLQEQETDTMTYEKYVLSIRDAFGIKTVN